MPEHSPAVIAVDQGTSATKALLIRAGEIVRRHRVDLDQQHPGPGWVEQDPGALLESVIEGIEAVRPDEGPVIAAGLSTQRESALAWDPETGAALSPVISWQDRRTTDRAHQMHEAAETVRRISGLPLDPMFSALKFNWLLDDLDPSREAARSGRIALGTVDSWIAARLSGEHRIEIGNASRTQLLDISTGEWSEELLELFDIPKSCLPWIAPSDRPVHVPDLDLTFQAVLGDSHAALYAHGVRASGEFKATYGTGSSVLGLDSGLDPVEGLVRTIAWGIDGGISHALEGNILSAGATVSWLASVLDAPPEELARLAQQTDSSDGVDIVPGFHGLGAPWWDEDAVAVLCGMGLGTGRPELARAAFESIVLQVDDAIRAARAAVGGTLEHLYVDGGPSNNDWLMQLQADLSDQPLTRHECAESSALGAARLAADSADVDLGPLADMPSTRFVPDPGHPRESRRRQWHRALARSRGPAPAHSIPPDRRTTRCTHPTTNQENP